MGRGRGLPGVPALQVDLINKFLSLLRFLNEVARFRPQVLLLLFLLDLLTRLKQFLSLLLRLLKSRRVLFDQVLKL